LVCPGSLGGLALSSVNGHEGSVMVGSRNAAQELRALICRHESAI